MSAQETIERIATIAENFGRLAGVGAMETAGSIISFLANHPEHIDDFMSGKSSLVDWPIGWHEQGRLTWHAQNGKIVSPQDARLHRTVQKMRPRP